MAAILQDSVVIIVFTHLQAIPLAMITMLGLAALQAAGAPLLNLEIRSTQETKSNVQMGFEPRSSMKWHNVRGILAICQRKILNGCTFDETLNFLNLVDWKAELLFTCRTKYFHQDINETKFLASQVTNLTRHCLLTSHYFGPWCSWWLVGLVQGLT